MRLCVSDKGLPTRSDEECHGGASIPGWLRDLAWFCGWAVLSLGVGFFINANREKPLAIPYVSKVDRLQQAAATLGIDASREGDKSSSAREISLDEFREMSATGAALIVDTRPEPFHALGHVPGALSLPRDTFVASYLKGRVVLEQHKDLPVLLYCSGDPCEESHLIGGALQQLGFIQVYIFTGGWRQWQEMELPEER